MEAVPARYIRACGEDLAKAQARWGETLLWREEAVMNQLLYTPQPNFARLLRAYPSFLHGRDREGSIVWYEQLGKVAVSELLRSGVTIEEVLLHKLYISEYLWRVAEPNPEAQCLTVLDLAGLKLGDFKGAATTFVKRYAELMAQHYPNRSKMIVVLNAPFFFTAIWKVASKTLDAETRGKVVIWKRPKVKRGKRKTSRCIELERYVALEEQPRCYGHPWKSAYQWGQAPEHLALVAWVEQTDAGMEAATRGGGAEDGRELSRTVSNAMLARFRSASDAMSARFDAKAIRALAVEEGGGDATVNPLELAAPKPRVKQPWER